MSCLITGSINSFSECRDGMAGIQEVLLSNITSAGTFTEAGGTVSAITGATGAYYSFKPKKNTGSLTETITTNVENGTTFYAQNIVLKFGKMEVTKRNIIKTLAQATLVALVLDQNDNWWMVGRVNGLDLTAGTIETGAAKGDPNGYSITLSAQEKEPAPIVTTAIIAALRGA